MPKLPECVGVARRRHRCLHVYAPGIAPPIVQSTPTPHRSCAHAGCDKPLVYEGHRPLRQP